MAKIAVLGFGTVGSGTVELFYKNKEQLQRGAGTDLDIKYILDVRDADAFPDSPYRHLLTSDFEQIVSDPEVTVAAELIGGATFAYDYVKRLLSAGKSVVSSNKELVATHGAELLAVAKEHSVNYFFEASVGGGIPIIRPLHQCLLTDEIQSVSGILNGTTNYILTRMFVEHIPFEEALRTAQELGYAERNPDADILGHDTCRKICILASLVFGREINPDHVYTEGIDKITPGLLTDAFASGYSVKLIGIAKAAGGGVELSVEPMLVPCEHQLSNVSDVFNAILVRGAATGEVLFYGRGAGKMPTASAVLSDAVNAVKAGNTSRSLFWAEAPDQSFVRRYTGKRDEKFGLSVFSSD